MKKMNRRDTQDSGELRESAPARGSATPRKPCPLCTSAGVFERTLNSIDLARCSACGFVYGDLDDAAIEAANFHFDQQTIDEYRGLQTWVDRFWFAGIAQRITRRVGRGTVLDVGCGNGLLLRQFVSLGWRGVGLDPSPWAQSCAAGYEVVQSTLDQAAFPDDHFEAVTNTAVLEHTARPKPYVEEVLRILKPGGCAYFNVPNYGSLTIRLGVSNFPSNTPPCHANYFTHRTLRRLYAPLSDRIETLTIRSYGIPQSYGAYVWIHRKLRRKTAGSPAPAPPSAPLKTKEPQRILAWLLGTVYYNTGRPFKLGDKLEVMVVKRRS